MHPTQKQANPVEVTPAFTLRAAATYLERYGWTTGDYYDYANDALQPPACVMGAIGMAVHGTDYDTPDDMGLNGWSDFHAARMALLNYLENDGHSSIQDGRETSDWDDELQRKIFLWNDESDQTTESVIITLQEAADEWDRTHGGAR